MKKILTVILFFITINSFAQTTLINNINNYGFETSISNHKNGNINNLKSTQWSVAEKVSGHPNEDSRDMGIAIGPDSTIYVAYCDDVPGLPSIARQKVTFTKKELGQAWTSPIIVDEFNGIDPRNDHEVSISVAQNNDVYIVYHYWAYDGTGRNQIACSKYTKQTDTWSTEIISGDSGTVYATYSDYPRITITENNIPVVVWGNDNTNEYDEAYICYNNGTWQTPIQISSTDTNIAQFPRAVSIENEKVFLLFREYNVAKDSLALYYRIFDANNGSLTPIKKIKDSQRASTSNFDTYYNYDICYNNNDSVFIALNSEDSIITYYYDINNDTLTKTSHSFKTNVSSSYTNYNLLSVAADLNGKIHFAYTVWNTNNNAVKYVNYNPSTGYSTPENISVYDALDAPQIVFGIDNKLHVAYCDDHEDTNNDGYVDREVYYTYINLNTEINSTINLNNTTKIYPNPSNGIYRIDNYNDSKITVTNLSGEIVLKTNNSNFIDITNQANGIYLIKVENEKGIFYSKLIKQ